MATNQRTAADAYRCPGCSGVLSCVDGSWGCDDCHYVPGHGAD